MKRRRYLRPVWKNTVHCSGPYVNGVVPQPAQRGFHKGEMHVCITPVLFKKINNYINVHYMDAFDCLLQHLVHAILCIQYLHCYVINYHYIFSGKNGLKMIISQLFPRQYIGQQKVVIVTCLGAK